MKIPFFSACLSALLISSLLAACMVDGENADNGVKGRTPAAGAAGTGGGNTHTSGTGDGANAGSGGSASNNEGSAGRAATAGAAGTTSQSHWDVPRGESTGCGKAPSGADNDKDFTRHDLEVSGVDPEFISKNPPQESLAPYTWTFRNYFLKLPVNYDPKRAYPINLAGGGCGGDEFSGQSGGLKALPNGQSEAIQVGLSYVYSGGACFADNYVNSPDLPYFDAVLKDVEARYCIDKSRVFVSGFSSGAWETFMLGCSRAGVVRGIGTAAGGLRLTRPPCSGVPIAAMMIAGIHDEENPIGPLAEPKHDSYGSAPSRDEILLRNGCVSSENVPWDPAFPECVKYTGCPAAFPVVWCAIDDGHSSGHPAGGPDYSGEGIWKFWSALPPVP